MTHVPNFSDNQQLRLSYWCLNKFLAPCFEESDLLAHRFRSSVDRYTRNLGRRTISHRRFCTQKATVIENRSQNFFARDLPVKYWKGLTKGSSQFFSERERVRYMLSSVRLSVVCNEIDWARLNVPPNTL